MSSFDEEVKQLKDFQELIFSSNLDSNLIATKIKELKETFSPKDIDRQLILAFSLNYQRVPILAKFLSEPTMDYKDFIHHDHELLFHLLKNNINFKPDPYMDMLLTSVIDDTFDGYDYVELLETYIEKYLYEELKKQNKPDLHFEKITRGINRKSLNIREKTQIEEIIEKDDINSFRLLSNDSDFNFNEIIQRDSDLFVYSKIPLILYCIERNAIKCFKYALLNGADPSAKCILVTENNFGGLKINDQWDGYGFAGAIGSLQIIKLLEGQNIPLNQNLMEGCSKFHQNHLIHWIEKEHKTLLKDGLIECIRYRNYEGFEIISQNIDIINFSIQLSQKNFSTFFYAALTDSKEIGELLISKGADINQIVILKIIVLFLLLL